MIICLLLIYKSYRSKKERKKQIENISNEKKSTPNTKSNILPKSF